MAQERERIARELHDILAHSVSLMIIASDGAEAAIEQENIGEARKAVAAIGRTGRDALTDLRLLLGMLRTDRGMAEPQPGIDQLEELVGSVPLTVRLRVEGPPRELPQGLALAVFRIVQESLTSAVKHAGPEASADVRLRYSSSAMEVEVSDDGCGLIPPSRNGHGLIGMWMISLEAVLLGLIGAVAEVAFGIGFGWATGRAFLRTDGGPVSYPVLQIVGYVALAAVAALVDLEQIGHDS